LYFQTIEIPQQQIVQGLDPGSTCRSVDVRNPSAASGERERRLGVSNKRRLGPRDFPRRSQEASVVRRSHALTHWRHLPHLRRFRVLLQEVLRPPVDDGLALYDLEALRVELVAPN